MVRGILQSSESCVVFGEQLISRATCETIRSLFVASQKNSSVDASPSDYLLHVSVSNTDVNSHLYLLMTQFLELF